MKVKELMKILESLNPDIEITYNDKDWLYNNEIHKIEYLEYEGINGKFGYYNII